MAYYSAFINYLPNSYSSSLFYIPSKSLFKYLFCSSTFLCYLDLDIRLGVVLCDCKVLVKINIKIYKIIF